MLLQQDILMLMLLEKQWWKSMEKYLQRHSAEIQLTPDAEGFTNLSIFANRAR